MFVETHHALVASASAQMTTVQAGVPIIPILLLPFILVFFVVVFPLWGVSLGVLWLLASIARGLAKLANLAGVEAFDGLAPSLQRAFRWVLTFGGFTERGKDAAQS